MTPVYFKLAFAGILGGCMMIAAGLDMQWQGAAAILVGGIALSLGLRASAAVARHPSGPAAREDLRPPPAAPASPRVWPRHLLNQIDAAPDGTGFVVAYGDYLSCIPVTADLGQLPRGQQLRLALRASPGADAAAPTEMDHESVSGLMEDYFVRYECRLGVSPANVLALRATRLTWTAAAERLAAPVDPPPAAVAAVRETMAALARRHVEAHDRFRDLGFRLSEAEPGSPRAAALAAELRSALDEVARLAAAGPPGQLAISLPLATGSSPSPSRP